MMYVVMNREIPVTVTLTIRAAGHGRCAHSVGRRTMRRPMRPSRDGSRAGGTPTHSSSAGPLDGSTTSSSSATDGASTTATVPSRSS